MNRSTRNRREFVTSRLRLRDYDYTTPAYYFVTVCCQDRQHYFGTITYESVNLSPAGEMVNALWTTLPPQFSGVSIDVHVTMPNHVHALVGIGVKPEDPDERTSLIEVVQWYKSVSTTRYIAGVKNQNWPRFNRRVWQQGFHDHIVRNERELEELRDYIANNPKRWESDVFSED